MTWMMVVMFTPISTIDTYGVVCKEHKWHVDSAFLLHKPKWTYTFFYYYPSDTYIGNNANASLQEQLLTEDWRLSQFWYDSSTAQTVAELRFMFFIIGHVYCLSCAQPAIDFFIHLLINWMELKDPTIINISIVLHCFLANANRRCKSEVGELQNRDTFDVNMITLLM